MAESMYADSTRRAALALRGKAHETAGELVIPSANDRDHDSEYYTLLDSLIEDANDVPRPSKGALFNRPISVSDDFNLGDANWLSADDDGTGTNTFTTNNGTWIEVLTAGADNDYHFMYSEGKPVVLSELSSGDQVVFSARVIEGTQNGSEANYVVGLSDCVDSAVVIDDGAGPCNDYDHIIFYAVDGGNAWASSIAANGASVGTCASIAADTCVEAELGLVIDVGVDEDGDACATKARVQFLNNGTVEDTQEVVIANQDDPMHVLFGAKAGAGNAAGLCVDYINVSSPRRKS